MVLLKKNNRFEALNSGKKNTFQRNDRNRRTYNRRNPNVSKTNSNGKSKYVPPHMRGRVSFLSKKKPIKKKEFCVNNEAFPELGDGNKKVATKENTVDNSLNFINAINKEALVEKDVEITTSTTFSIENFKNDLQEIEDKKKAPTMWFYGYNRDSFHRHMYKMKKQFDDFNRREEELYEICGDTSPFNYNEFYNIDAKYEFDHYPEEYSDESSSDEEYY